jgi:hypothetical protein
MQEREVPQEVGLAQDASSVQQLSASYFSTHTAHETSLRSANELPSSSSPSSPSSSSSSSFSSSDISFQKYHFECAINYRLGQRKVLMQAVEEVEQRINAEGIKAQEKLSSSSPSTTAESAPASSKSDAPPRKSRKTGASTAASAASSSPSAYSSSPSISSSDVASWSAWFASQGGRINADFQIDGSWRVKDSTAAKETADGFTMLPLLYSFPLASCNPSRSPGFAPVWEFLQQRQAASEDGGEEEEPRPAEEIDWMRYALPLWLWQEILAPQSSTIAPWLRIVWPRAQHRQQQELVQQPFLTEEQQTVLDAVQSGDSKIALRFKSLDARHFSTVLRLVQEFSVELPRGGEEGENERVLVMVPSMPRRTPRKDGAHTSATILQDSAGVPRLILHSSSSLPGGSSVSLSSTFSIAPPLHRRATDVEDVAVRMSGIIGVYSALAEPAEDGDQDEDTMMRDAHNNAASIVPSFGIPLQPLGQAHIKLWRSLGLDAEADDEVYLDPSSMALPLLLAVVRSFFVPGKLLRGGTGAAEVRSRGSKPDALQVSGSKIDDSDEEDAATTSSAGASSSKHEHQADEPMEEDQEQEEEGDDDATMPTPAELDHASHAFARHLLQQEIDRRGSSEADLADIAILKNALERL